MINIPYQRKHKQKVKHEAIYNHRPLQRKKKIQPKISSNNIQEGKDKTFMKINLRSTRLGRGKKSNFKITPFNS